MMGDFEKQVKKGSFKESICDKLDEMMGKVGSGNGADINLTIHLHFQLHLSLSVKCSEKGICNIFMWV